MTAGEEKYIELLKLGLIDLLGPTTHRAALEDEGSVRSEQVPEKERYLRLEGRDWPFNGMTMIGYKRLSALQFEIERIVREEVPGDFIETGIWRGGSVIFMRALLDLLGDDRKVYGADSFRGLPAPDPAYPRDETGPALHTVDFLSVSVKEVERNCHRYGSMVGIELVEGWFEDTLPGIKNQWALIRLDGDMYGSTMVALKSLYPDLSSGGSLIVDDWGVLHQCQDAVKDYRASEGIDAEIHEIDWTGVQWIKP